MAPFLTVENRAGQATPFRGNTLVPITQVWRLRPPGLNRSIIWNRPVSVVIQEMDDQEQVVPIQDVTRQAIWLLAGLSLASLLLSILANRKRCTKHSQEPEKSIKESNP